jgi:hypothetical protein
MTRAEIKAVFRRNHGAKIALARQLEIEPCNISEWFRNQGRSKRVDAAIRARAAELLAAEHA